MKDRQKGQAIAGRLLGLIFAAIAALLTHITAYLDAKKWGLINFTG